MNECNDPACPPPSPYMWVIQCAHFNDHYVVVFERATIPFPRFAVDGPHTWDPVTTRFKREGEVCGDDEDFDTLAEAMENYEARQEKLLATPDRWVN